MSQVNSRQVKENIMTSKRTLRHILFLAVAVAALIVTNWAGTATATDGTWVLNANGSWSILANWSDLTIADGQGATANITNDITGNRTITIDGAVASRTLGILNVGDINNSHSFTINANGGATLTFDNNDLAAQINQTNTSKANTISAPILLKSSLNISNADADGLTISGTVTGNSLVTRTISNVGAGAGTVTISGIIADGSAGGTVAILQNGTSPLTLSGANTFTGGVTLSAGKLTLGHNNALGGAAGTFTINGGMLDVNAARTTPNNNPVTIDGDFTFQGTNTLDLGTGAISLGTAAGTSRTITANASTLTLGGAVSDGTTATGLTKAGAGTLVLSGANTHTGPTTISAGTLSVGTADNLGAAAANLVFDGGRLQVMGTALTSLSGGVSRTAVFNDGKTVSLDINDAANTFTADQVLNQGSGGLTKAGAGTLVLNQANTYTGTTTISAGTLVLRNGESGLTQTLGTLTPAGPDVILQSDNAGTGTLSTSLGAVTRTAGSTANIVFTGGTVGTDNIINLTGAAGFVDKGVFFHGADYAARNATDGYVRALAYGTDPDAEAVDTITASKHVKLTTTPVGQDSNSLLTLNLAGGGVDYTQNASQTLTVPGILKAGGGAVSTISGGTAVTAGTGIELVIRTDTASDLLAVSTPVTGTGALTKSGAGTLTLSGVSTYSGATAVNGGTLEIGGDGLLGSGTYAGAIAIVNGATVNFNSSATQTLSGIISGGGGLTKAGSGTLTLSGANTFTGPVTLTSGTLKANTNATALGTGAATLALNGGTLGLGHNANVSLTFGRNTTVGGDVTILLERIAGLGTTTYTLGALSIGANTLTVQGGNTTKGTAVVAFGATSLTGAATFNVTKPAGGGNTQLTFSGPVDNGGFLLTVGGNGNIDTASGVISGAGGLTKNGDGTLSIRSSTNSFTGTTTLNGGVTRIYSNLSPGPLTFNGGVLEDYWYLNFTRSLGDGPGQFQITGGASGFSENGASGTVRINNDAAYQVVWGSTYFNPSALVLQAVTAQSSSGRNATVNFLNPIDLNGATRTIEVDQVPTAGVDPKAAVISGVIGNSTGTAGLNKTGVGKLSLSAANTFNGPTTISNGWLNLTHALALQNSALDTTNSITGTDTVGLRTNQTSLTLGGLTGNKDFASLFTTAATAGYSALASLTLNPGAGVINSYSGVIANGAAGMTLIKTGEGTQVLSGANTYTGATTVNAGTLVLSGSAAVNGAAAVNGGTLKLDYASSDTGKISDSAVLTLGGGTLELAGGTHTEIVASTALASGASNVIQTGGGAKIAMGDISPVGGVVNFGAGNIATTTTANDPTGILGLWATVAGTDWAANDGSGNIVAYTGYADIAATGDTINDGAATNVRINSAGTGGNLALGAAATTVNTILQNTATASTIDTAGKTLAVGGIRINSGQEAVTVGAAVGDGTLQAAAPGGALFLINNNAGKTLTVNAAIADNTSASALSTVGNVQVNAVNTYTGATTVGGTLEIGGTGQLGNGPIGIGAGATLSVAAAGQLGGGAHTGDIAIGMGGALAYGSSANQGLGGIISGAGGLTKTGSGTLTLSGASTFSGGVKFEAGSLRIDVSNTALGTGALDIGAATGSTAVTLDSLSARTIANPVNINQDFTYTGTSDLVLGTGAVTLTGGTRTITVSAGNLTLGGAISDQGGGLTKTGPGTMFFSNSGQNSFTGQLTVEAGALSISVFYEQSSTAGTLGPDGLTVILGKSGGSTGTLQYTGGNDNILNKGFTLADGGTGAFEITNAATNFALTSPISGGGALAKTGVGTLTLNGAKTYTGDTIVEIGTLSINTPYLADAADVYLTSEAIFNLNFTGTDTISKLFFDDVGQAVGTWGRIGSDADHPSSLFTGDGLLLVTTAVVVPGDTNGNKVVDAADFINLKKNFGKSSGATLAQGDFNNTGTVDWTDLSTLMTNMGTVGSAPATTPEPCSAMLLVFGAAALLRRRAKVGRVGQ